MSKKHKRFQGIVMPYMVQLYRYAYWLSGSPDISKDLVQETLLRAWRSFDSLKDGNVAKYWLITILKRENARRFEHQTLYQVTRDVEELESSQVEIDTSPEGHVLKMALERLADEYRDPLLLQVIWGYSCKEIAHQLNISPGAVMTRLFRARNALRQQITQEVDEQEEQE